MSEAWVPFHASLRQGDKRGLPRSVRFIFLELSLLARPTDGRIALPRGFKSDLDALHDILGGDRREIRSAIELLTVPLDPTDPLDEPMIRIVGPETRRVLEIPSHGRWVQADSSAVRMRRLREKQKQQQQQLTLTCDVTSDAQGDAGVTEGVTDKRKERKEKEKKRSDVTSPTSQPPSLPSQLSLSGEPKANDAVNAKASKRSVKTGWPEGFKVSPAIEAMCRAEDLPNPHVVLSDFESKARANAYRYADWEAAFRNWMRSAITRRDYPTWSASEIETPPPKKVYGPPAAMTPEIMAIRQRLAGIGGDASKAADGDDFKFGATKPAGAPR